MRVRRCTQGEIPEDWMPKEFWHVDTNSAKQNPGILFSVERIPSERKAGWGMEKRGFYSVTTLVAYTD